MKEAIILAGGLGTRLSHVVSDVQKAMAPVGGRPFLTYVLDGLKKYGFEKAVLAVGYKQETVKAYFGDSYRGIKIVYSAETEPLGTGGAIKKALLLTESDCLPVINGDTYYETDFSALDKVHRDKNADITVSVRQMENYSRYGTVRFDSKGLVTSFEEKKPTEKGCINTGVYYINRGVTDNIDGKFSFEKEILEKPGRRVFAFPGNGYFIDIGIPGDYLAAQTELRLNIGENVFRAVFLDRDGTVNKEKNYVHDIKDFEFIPGAQKAIARLREHGYLIIVVTNQAGVAKGLYGEEEVNILHGKINELLGVKAHIDEFFYCPYHENAVIPEYRKKSPDRKPGTGMIDRAVKVFSDKGIKIDLEHSFFIGDTAADIKTGTNAGIGTKILVLSGHGTEQDGSEADCICLDLAEAAEKITEKELFPWEKEIL